MMQDFNTKGAVEIDENFMTLADTVILTTKDLDPILQKNPFTGVAFTKSQNKNVVRISTFVDWQAHQQTKLTQFKKDTTWAFVKDNVYDPACWSKTSFTEKE